MTKDVGTLKEIGAQVGDVVQVVGGPRWKIIGGNADKGFIINDPVAPILSRDLPFRIVSPAKPQGPVRTVTRKEIVPGVYGKVQVSNKSGSVGVWTLFALMTSEDLTAAIATLTEIRDAMEDQG